MKRFSRLVMALALVATLGLASACQRTVEVQTGTRIVDEQGRVISEDIKTIRVPQETAGAYRSQHDRPARRAQPAGRVTLRRSPERHRSRRPQARRRRSSPRSSRSRPPTATPRSKPTPSRPARRSRRTPSRRNLRLQRAHPSPPRLPSLRRTPPPSCCGGLPDALEGFTAAKAAVDPLSASREYKPASGNPAARLVIVAEQFRTSADAKRALAVDVKQRYPNDANSSQVHGHPVYFGTDGRDFAVIGFTSGAMMVALEASPDSGSPVEMKAVLEKALGQLP